MTRQLPLILAVAGLAYSGGEIFDLMRLMLDKADFETDVQVVSVTKVVETARRQNPALIIIGHRPLSPESSDIMGATIVQALKADSQTRCIPVLLLEGLVHIEQVAQECGADAYLQTPIGPKEFLDTVRGLIE